MRRPQLEVADIIRSAGTDFIERNRSWLRWTHLKVLLAIARCRTAVLGGHIDECTGCGHRATISYNSCRNRHCPKCQTGARERWIAARRRELLPTPYVHVVFTLPPQLATLALQNRKLIYGLLLRASAETLLEVAYNPAHLGAEIGFFSVLHTLEPETPTSPPCPLCRSRRRTLPRSRPLDSIPPTLLPSHCCTAARVSWQVRRRPEVCLRTPSTAPSRRTRTARPSQVLRCLAASALPQRLDRLLQTTLRRTRVRPAVSRPLYAPRRHLQPSLGRIGGRPGYLSLARLRRPQSAESNDRLTR